MNAEEFLETVIRPTLRQMDMYSPAAEKLLLMTACHESGGFRHRVQVGGGPAVSYFQIEPATFEDVWDRYLGARPDRKAKVAEFLIGEDTPLQQLQDNDRFACAVARMKYAMVPQALPDVDDDVGLAHYCKEHWNTVEGAATPEKYLTDYITYKPDDYS